jgi:signal transduction histidine kinase
MLWWAGAGLLAVFAALTVAMAVWLADAGKLLGELNTSQEQLAQVTSVEAGVNGMFADLALEPSPGPDLTRDAAGIDQQLGAYRASIAAEGRDLGDAPAAVAHQAAEAQRAERLAQLFSEFKADLQTGDAGRLPQSRIAAHRARLGALVDQIVRGERGEAAETMARMRRLRERFTWIGLGALVVVGALGAAGAWLMTKGVAGPLRQLAEAAERAGRGQSPGELEVGGFSEFARFAQVFQQMAAQIAAQRQALSDANAGLEVQVEERTREIEDSRRKLAETDEARRLLFSRLSHELRTPATIIRGEAEVALREPKASTLRLREALGHVAANGAFLQRRLEDMLALARAEDGRLSLQPEPLDLKALAAEVAALAEPYVRSSGMALDCELPHTDGPEIQGDPSWLKQALLALIDNAAKFAADGRRIRLSLRTDAGMAHLEVQDDGPGVEQAELGKIFDSYYRSAAGGSRPGSGLGLSVARWVAEKHGGSITAESPPDGGLTIRISLPVAS